MPTALQIRFLFGAKPEVIDALCGVINTKYPNIKIAGAVNGYVSDKDGVMLEGRRRA